MKKTILELLKTKFEGVSERILDRIAEKLAKTVNDEDEAKTAVEGFTIQQLLDSNGDARATEASASAVRNYETKHGLKDGKAVSKKTTESEGGKEPEIKDDIPAWAMAMIESNKALADELKAMKGEKIESGRRERLNAIIKDLPENVRKAYARTPVKDMTDEEFDCLADEIKTEAAEIAKTSNVRGAVFGVPKAGAAAQGKATDEEVAAIVAGMNI